MYAQLTDLVEAIGMLKDAKNSGLQMWEAITLFAFILKDVLIVGGILGTIIWYVKRRDAPVDSTDCKQGSRYIRHYPKCPTQFCSR